MRFRKECGIVPEVFFINHKKKKMCFNNRQTIFPAKQFSMTFHISVCTCSVENMHFSFVGASPMIKRGHTEETESWMSSDSS